MQAPRSLPRLIQLPASSVTGERIDFVFLSSVIHALVDELFPGMEITGCYQFRVTRNSDLYVDEEEVDDLMRALEGELLRAATATRCGSRSRTTARSELASSCSSTSS